jgi:exosortase
MSTDAQLMNISRRYPGWIVWPSLLFALILILYGPILSALVRNWWDDSDYNYAFLVPLFSLYLLWRQRERLIALEIRPCNWGLPMMLAAVGLLIFGSLGAEVFTSRLSFLVLLAGVILFLAGGSILRSVFFPLAFLMFMIPVPTIIYNQITFPLQLLASRLASSLLNVIGVPVLRDGNVLTLSNYSLEVVEACSGIRSLISLIALAIVYGYLAEPRRWARYLLVVLMVPCAIVTNGVRVALAGALAHRFGPQAAEGFLHEFSGWLIFLLALVLMFGIHVMVRHLGGLRTKRHV